jgi:hypothetical protein
MSEHLDGKTTLLDHENSSDSDDDVSVAVVDNVDNSEIKKNKKNDKRKQPPATEAPKNLPFELLSAGPHFFEYLQCGNEVNHKERDTSRRDTEYLVAKSIVLLDENGEEEFTQHLDSLNIKQLRWLANKMGCRNAGSNNKFVLRLILAERKHTKTHYNLGNISPLRSIDTLISNNYLRVINSIFFNDVNFSKFMLINDKKCRHYFERGNGPKEIYFWDQVASLCNNPDADLIGEFMSPSTDLEDYDKYLTEAKLDDMTPAFNEAGFCDKSCKTIINNLVKIRARMVANMTKSGTHDSDPMEFTEAAIHKHNLVRTVHPFVAYYFFVACKERKGVDFVLTRYLPEACKCDTTTPMKERVTNANNTAKAKMSKQNEVMNALFDKIDESNKLLSNHLVKTQQYDYLKKYSDMSILVKNNPYLLDDPIIKKQFYKLKKDAGREINNNEEDKPIKKMRLEYVDDDDDSTDSGNSNVSETLFL